MAKKKTVLVVLPTEWDARQLDASRSDWEHDYTVRFAEPTDADCPFDFDPSAFVEQTVRRERGRIDGVISSSDYPGATLAAAIATELGLPGSKPASVVGASHKYYSRRTQRAAAPEATAGFRLVDPKRSNYLHEGDERVGYPCFVKPVKGAFSLLARKVADAAELEAFMSRPAVTEFCDAYMAVFNKIVAAYTDFIYDGRYFIAESLLSGRQATVEGYVHEGRVEILGVVDSGMYPGTSSFQRFDYPSTMSPEAVAAAADVAQRVVAATGLDATLFNMEVLVDESDGVARIVELNPRICGQFADLYRKVDGTGSYRIALDLATGTRPDFRRGAGACGAAASFPLRVFEPCTVERAPSDHALRAAQALVPQTLVWTECAQGARIDDFESVEDGQSSRYAVLNIGSADRESLDRDFETVRERLGYRFTPIR